MSGGASQQLPCAKASVGSAQTNLTVYYEASGRLARLALCNTEYVVSLQMHMGLLQTSNVKGTGNGELVHFIRHDPPVRAQARPLIPPFK